MKKQIEPMRKLVVVALLAGVLIACSNEEKTPSGLAYKLVTKGKGTTGTPGDYIVFSMRIQDAQDSVWEDTYKNDFPAVFPVLDSGQRKDMQGLIEVLQLLKQGDSALLKLSAKDLFEKTYRVPVPAKVDTAALFTVALRINRFYSRAQIDSLNIVLQARQQEKEAIRVREQRAADSVKIDTYLAAKGFAAERTPNGLRYMVLRPGSGPLAQNGDEIKVHYAGYLLDDAQTLFDTSIESVATERGTWVEGRTYSPLTLVLGRGSVIQGWEEAATLMNKGARLRVFIPSHLAYGPNRVSREIGENEVLMFEMELIDLKKEKR